MLEPLEDPPHDTIMDLGFTPEDGYIYFLIKGPENPDGETSIYRVKEGASIWDGFDRDREAQIVMTIEIPMENEFLHFIVPSFKMTSGLFRFPKPKPKKINDLVPILHRFDRISRTSMVLTYPDTVYSACCRLEFGEQLESKPIEIPSLEEKRKEWEEEFAKDAEKESEGEYVSEAEKLLIRDAMFGDEGRLYELSNDWGDWIHIQYEGYYSKLNHVLIHTAELPPESSKSFPRTTAKPGEEKIYFRDIKNITFREGVPGDSEPGYIEIGSEKSKDSKFMYFLGDGRTGYGETISGNMWKVARQLGRIAGRNAEKNLDESRAIMIFEEFSFPDEAKRIRQKMRDEGKIKVDQTVVHGDYVDDRDTIVKDSVVNKSSIGAGGDGDDLTAKLQQLAQMHRDGILSDEQFEAAKNKLLN